MKKKTRKMAAVIRSVPPAIGAIEKRREALVQEIASIRQAGMVNATLFWQQGRFLYLNHRSAGPRRVRAYVGNDPQRVAEAYARVNRYQVCLMLERMVKELDNELQRVEEMLDAVMGDLRRLRVRPEKKIDRAQLQPPAPAQTDANSRTEAGERAIKKGRE
ncbi:MAG: hypothetical protein ABL931_22850 [Usitatibacteraceae bacterium]